MKSYKCTEKKVLIGPEFQCRIVHNFIDFCKLCNYKVGDSLLTHYSILTFFLLRLCPIKLQKFDKKYVRW